MVVRLPASTSNKFPFLSYPELGFSFGSPQLLKFCILSSPCTPWRRSATPRGLGLEDLTVKQPLGAQGVSPVP